MVSEYCSVMFYVINGSGGRMERHMACQGKNELYSNYQEHWISFQFSFISDNVENIFNWIFNIISFSENECNWNYSKTCFDVSNLLNNSNTKSIIVSHFLLFNELPQKQVTGRTSGCNNLNSFWAIY